MNNGATSDCELELTGIDGSNPLGFLAAVGTLVTCERLCGDTRLSWRYASGAWRPILHGLSFDQESFVEALLKVLQSLPTNSFRIDKKMPFSADDFRAAALAAPASPDDRRDADLIAAFGCDSLRDGDNFVDTAFRMVRSGDAAGQGFLHYAAAIREQTDVEHLRRTLFKRWDYADDSYSLRWDPVEDSNYALRWRDPSKDAKNTMLGANSLALEALLLFPAVPNGSRLETSGFHRHGRNMFFTWPIWESPLNVNAIRSLLVLRELHVVDPNRLALQERGIVTVYRSRRFAPNQYYRNFTPANTV